MRVLLIDAFRPDDPDRVLTDRAEAVLRGRGHEVEVRRLVDDGFATVMSGPERAAYETDEPLRSDETRAAAEAVLAADALLFCYPTVTFTVPAVLKGWLERVMVLGVAFSFDRKGRVRPALRRIRRIGVVTTTRHGRWTTVRHRDGGRRILLWTLRLNCHRFCRRTRLAVPAGAGASPVVEQRLAHALGRW